MPLGYVDPATGIYIFGTDDPYTSESIADMLNRGQTRTRDAMAGVLEDVAEVNMSAPRVLPSPTGAGGYVVDGATRMLKLGPIVLLSLILTKASGGITTGTAATIPALIGARPIATVTEYAAASGGSAASVLTTITTGGDIRVWTASSGNNMLNLTTFFVAV